MHETLCKSQQKRISSVTAVQATLFPELTGIYSGFIKELQVDLLFELFDLM